MNGQFYPKILKTMEKCFLQLLAHLTPLKMTILLKATALLVHILKLWKGRPSLPSFRTLGTQCLEEGHSIMFMAKMHGFSFYEKLKLSCSEYPFLFISVTQASTKGIIYTHDMLRSKKLCPKVTLRKIDHITFSSLLIKWFIII